MDRVKIIVLYAPSVDEAQHKVEKTFRRNALATGKALAAKSGMSEKS